MIRLFLIENALHPLIKTGKFSTGVLWDSFRVSPKRNKKGSVAVHNRDGMLRLRWTYLGRGYSFAMGLADNPINRAAAAAKAAEIQKDLAFHEFDPTLEKYRPKPLPTSLGTAELFQQFIDHKLETGAIAQQTASSLYLPLKRMIGKRTIRNRKEAEQLIQQLSKQRSPKSCNQALCLYKAFGNWAVESGLMTLNPFEGIKSVRVPRTPNKRKPFTSEEIKKILSAIAKDERLSHYYDFCVLLFSLGLRPSEAIGLRWGSVDLDAQTATISEALIRTPGPGRTRKGTKNSVVRVLQLSDALTNMFRARRPTEPDTDQLVFTSHRGRPINGEVFRQHYWKPACELAGVPYRPPYTARHTLISYGIEVEGWSLPQAAQVAGDSVGTIVNNYAHAIQPPSMPEWT